MYKFKTLQGCFGPNRGADDRCRGAVFGFVVALSLIACGLFIFFVPTFWKR